MLCALVSIVQKMNTENVTFCLFTVYYYILFLLTIIKPIQMKATVTKDFLLHSLPFIRLQMRKLNAQAHPK